MTWQHWGSDALATLILTHLTNPTVFVKYPTIYYFVTEMCTCMYIFHGTHCTLFIHILWDMLYNLETFCEIYYCIISITYFIGHTEYSQHIFRGRNNLYTHFMGFTIQSQSGYTAPHGSTPVQICSHHSSSSDQSHLRDPVDQSMSLLIHLSLTDKLIIKAPVRTIWYCSIPYSININGLKISHPGFYLSPKAFISVSLLDKHKSLLSC